MHILIIGTLGGQVGAASKIAIKQGGSVLIAESINEGLEILRSGKGAELVMIDVKLDVASLINSLENERINIPVVACGVESDTQAAVKAIKAGAKEYIPLPPDAEMIGAVLSAVSQESHAMIHKDPVMQNVVKIADQVAPSDASVLITGESGTGKEVFSHYIHSKSRRSANRFVAVNCAAIPDNLLESELFGYEKGAFTGAVSRRIGKFEEASGGTILLDEITEMDIRLQAKLLRAIQEKEIDRIGGKTPVKVDVRIIATSNRDMQEAIRNKEFREDLYFRLNVVNLRLPPLRERPQDIKSLADFFGHKYADANGLPNKPISEDAMKLLTLYSWPGNVRELENTMHRAVLMSVGSQIDANAIMLMSGEQIQMPIEATQPSASTSTPTTYSANADGLVGRTVASVERDLIIDTLKHTLGNRTHAANILGISIRTLRNKLKQYGDEGYEVPVAKE